ncbi:MAG TPA: hypothetical protein VEI97_08600 [bacterium]|nr:hypothetical protein [bacterium]
MPTRFYFPSSGSPPITPGFGTGWNRTTGAVQRPTSTTKAGTSMAEGIAMTSTATSPEFHLAAQFVSPALAAQTISGTIKGQFKCRENNASFNGTLAIGIRVVTSSGTHRAHLLNGAAATPIASDATTTPPEFATSATNRRVQNSAESFAPPITSFACNAGDYLVIEVGCRDVDTGTTRSGWVTFGDNSATDLAENETSTAADNPWIEFSGTITFQGSPTRGQVSFAELEVPSLATRGRISFAELEVPNVPTRGRISFAELELPNTPTRGRVSFAELELPGTPSRGQLSWSELELPDPPTPTRGTLSWAEMEFPSLLTRGQLSWAELEVPDVGARRRRRSRGGSLSPYRKLKPFNPYSASEYDEDD